MSKRTKRGHTADIIVSSSCGFYRLVRYSSAGISVIHSVLRMCHEHPGDVIPCNVTVNSKGVRTFLKDNLDYTFGTVKQCY